MQSILHYFLHFGLPLIIAYVFFRKEYKKAYLILLATMLVDLDHLLASPFFVADRCSIQFHPLHTYYAMLGYAVLLVLPKPYRIVGIGLMLHMLTDLNDCVLTYLRCADCLSDAPALPLVAWLGECYVSVYKLKVLKL